MPDAPAPTYDRHGNIVVDWTIRVGYHSDADIITLVFVTGAGPYHKESNVTLSCQPDEVETIIEVVTRWIRMAGARRLF